MTFQAIYSIGILAGWGGSTEGDEFVGNSPVQITILNSLEEFVIAEIKVPYIKPLQFYGVFQSTEAMQDL